MTPPKWRKQKPDEAGVWALWRDNPVNEANRCLVVRVMTSDLDTIRVQWGADAWMRLPDATSYDCGPICDHRCGGI